jgi:hypothetical protein
MAKSSKNRVSVAIISAIAFLSVQARAQSEPESAHHFAIQTNVIGNYNDSTTTWLNGGLSRFGLGSNDDSDNFGALGEIHAGYKYDATNRLSFRTHLQALKATEDSSARSLGVVEVKARYVAHSSWDQRVTLTAGQFFLPTSMENIERFWESPYTISFSTLNSWIGEEFRPVGLDLGYAKTLDSGSRWSVSGTAFGGNDSMGAILAWRGWSNGRHRSVFGDTLSLPDLAALDEGGEFDAQRDDGSKPFGRDLDGNVGFSVRSSWHSVEDYVFNFTWVDNMGDTELHHGEYAWRTKFGIAGAAWNVTPELELLGEFSRGSSTMGEGPGVDIDFYSVYIMASYLVNNLRYSARVEKFGIKDQDVVDDENNDTGRSYTAALMWEPPDNHFSGGAEVLYVDSKRKRTTTTGLFEDERRISVSIIGKYVF